MQNIESIRAKLSAYGVDAMLLTGASNRLYTTGFPSSDGVALVTGGGAWFFTDSRYIEAAEAAVQGAEVLSVGFGISYVQRINEALDAMHVQKLGFEEQAMSHAEYLQYEKELHAALTPAQALMTELRASKSREELDRMIRAQRIAEQSLQEILGLISTDMTEKELAAELLYRMLRNGAEDKSFDPIVVSAEKSSMPHGVPGDVKIRKGFLTIDFGAKYAGYCSDMTRTLCVGQPTEEMRRIYDTVLEAQLAGIAAAQAGVTGKAIDRAARDVIDAAGYGAYFGHSFGHSLGIDIHEAPNAAPSNDRPMPLGAVVSAEPGIYLPGKFGVRIEDVLYLTENGNENLTRTDKTLTVL